MTIAAGADVKVIHRMPGHADASMTLNTYADLRRDRLDEVTPAVSTHRDRALSAARSKTHHDEIMTIDLLAELNKHETSI